MVWFLLQCMIAAIRDGGHTPAEFAGQGAAGLTPMTRIALPHTGAVVALLSHLRSTSPMRKVLPIAFLLGLGAAVAAQAAEPQPAAAEVTFSGVKVGIDPHTGKLRPLTPAESRQLDQVLTRGKKPAFAPRLAKSFVAPATEIESRRTVRSLRHGGVAVKLPASQMSTVSVHRNADGDAVLVHDGEQHPVQTQGAPNE
jgi:hypothetical protein